VRILHPSILIVLLTMSAGTLLVGCETKGPDVSCPETLLTHDKVTNRIVQKDGTPFEILTFPQFKGVAFPKEVKGDGMGRKSDEQEFWTPSSAEIVVAEATLHSSLLGSLRRDLLRIEPQDAETIPIGLCHYNRQYVGTFRDGKKKLFVNFFRTEAFLPFEGTTFVSGPSAWETRAVVVYGDGANFFQASFDMGSKTWEWVEVNFPK
jgi:hypothetical protein